MEFIFIFFQNEVLKIGIKMGDDMDCCVRVAVR